MFVLLKTCLRLLYDPDVVVVAGIAAAAAAAAAAAVVHSVGVARSIAVAVAVAVVAAVVAQFVAGTLSQLGQLALNHDFPPAQYMLGAATVHAEHNFEDMHATE